MSARSKFKWIVFTWTGVLACYGAIYISGRYEFMLVVCAIVVFSTIRLLAQDGSPKAEMKMNMILFGGSFFMWLLLGFSSAGVMLGAITLLLGHLWKIWVRKLE